MNRKIPDISAELRRRVTESKMNDGKGGGGALFTFVQPAVAQKLPYREQQLRLRRAVVKHHWLSQSGSLLDTLEKGVAFPIMHVNWNPDIKQSQLQILKSDDLGSDVYVQQGLYEEVKRIEPDISFSDRDTIEHKAYIILGFKSLETGFSSVLEKTWRDWTGARSIYLKLHDEHDLARITFYHRVAPVNQLDVFMYLVVAECWNVTPKNLIRALDFVQRMRVERLNGYISIYRDLGSEDKDSNYHSESSERDSFGGKYSGASSPTLAPPTVENELKLPAI